MGGGEGRGCGEDVGEEQGGSRGRGERSLKAEKCRDKDWRTSAERWDRLLEPAGGSARPAPKRSRGSVGSPENLMVIAGHQRLLVNHASHTLAQMWSIKWTTTCHSFTLWCFFLLSCNTIEKISKTDHNEVLHLQSFSERAQ